MKSRCEVNRHVHSQPENRDSLETSRTGNKKENTKYTNRNKVK